MTDPEIIDTMVDTTITLKRNTRNEIASLGNKDSTFDEILRNLVKCWRETH
jgi:hypothetical protein